MRLSKEDLLNDIISLKEKLHIATEALEQIASWCPTPSNPDDCRIAECYKARKALADMADVKVMK